MKILMVDDDHDAMGSFRDLLDQKHQVKQVHTYTQACNEFEAARLAGKWTYDMLILDVQIQASEGEEISEDEALTSGLDLYNVFRKSFKTEKIVILTNNDHRVPPLTEEDENLVVCNKVSVSGSDRLLRVLQNLQSGD